MTVYKDQIDISKKNGIAIEVINRDLTEPEKPQR